MKEKHLKQKSKQTHKKKNKIPHIENFYAIFVKSPN